MYDKPAFLIVRFSSIGDIVLTSPVVRCIKKKWPQSTIHYVTKSVYAPILINNPHIDKLHLLEDSLQSLIRRLKKEHIDYIIDLHNNIRSYWLKKRLPSPSYTFDKINFRKWLKVFFKIDYLPSIHIVDRYLETLKRWNIRNDGEGLDYFIKYTEEVELKELPILFRKGYIGLVVGAKWTTKRMPINKLIELCDAIDYPMLLLGGVEDKEVAEKICVRSSNYRLYNTCGLFSINQSASLVRQAKYIITHDTGLMHIAAAFDKPITIIWGNTIPRFGMYAYLSNDALQRPINVEVDDLGCRPCSKIGFSSCPKKHFRCMQDISIQAIKQSIEFEKQSC